MVLPSFLVSQKLSCAQNANKIFDGKGRFQIRSSKLETNPNVPNSKVFSWFDIFEPLDFEFVSDFDIRISDFSILQSCLVPAAPG